jgi:hypothetical protein
MAVDQLGVTKPYVIACSPSAVTNGNFEAKDMVSVLMRSFLILMDESVRNEIAWARRAGAIVIDPLINVHGALTVEQGLLRINRDYGWMRAAEELTGVPPGTTGPIIEARLELYQALTAPTNSTNLPAARKHLQTLLNQADPALLPKGWQAWPNEHWTPPSKRSLELGMSLDLGAS